MRALASPKAFFVLRRHAVLPVLSGIRLALFIVRTIRAAPGDLVEGGIYSVGFRVSVRILGLWLDALSPSLRCPASFLVRTLGEGGRLVCRWTLRRAASRGRRGAWSGLMGKALFPEPYLANAGTLRWYVFTCSGREILGHCVG